MTPPLWATNIICGLIYVSDVRGPSGYQSLEICLQHWDSVKVGVKTCSEGKDGPCSSDGPMIDYNRKSVELMIKLKVKAYN